MLGSFAFSIIASWCQSEDQMRERNMNLHLHLQHLSESDDFLKE